MANGFLPSIFPHAHHTLCLWEAFSIYQHVLNKLDNNLSAIQVVCLFVAVKVIMVRKFITQPQPEVVID